MRNLKQIIANALEGAGASGTKAQRVAIKFKFEIKVLPVLSV